MEQRGGLEDSHHPSVVTEESTGSRAETALPSPGAAYTQPFRVVLAGGIGTFTFVFISTCFQHVGPTAPPDSSISSSPEPTVS